MIVKAALLAVVVLVGWANLAEAQPYFNGGVPGPQTTVGWNFGHISGCATHSDGFNTWFYVFAQEGGYGYTNNLSFAAVVAPVVKLEICLGSMC
jgi:hypothetical protein